MTDLLPTNPFPPSPYLPGTRIQYAWDSTSLGYLKKCPRYYQYRMIEGWQPKGENIHLRFGQEYHQALQEYDIERAEGISHDDALHDVVRELHIRTADFRPDLDSKVGKYKNRTSLIQAVIDYLDTVRNKDEMFKTHILQNGKPAVELSFSFELSFGPDAGQNAVWSASWDSDPENKTIIGPAPVQPYLLCGHLDRVVTDGDALYVEDHKTTTKTISDWYFDQFDVNNQMSLYSFAAQIILETPVKGVIIDACQLLLTQPTRFQRAMTHRTQDQLEEWITDLSRWLNQAEWYAVNNYWPQNDSFCAFCEFRGVCAKSPGVREIYLKSDFVQLPEEERWNPLKPR